MKVKKLLLIFAMMLISLVALSSCELIESVKPHSHSYGAWEETKAATCAEKGILTRKCECGSIEMSETPLVTHKEVTDSAVEATCTSTGLTEGKHCSYCKEIITEQKVVDVKDHTSVNGICVVCETVTEPLVALCDYVRDNANATEDNLAMITDFRINSGTNLVYAIAASDSADQLAFVLYYQSGTDKITVYVIMEEISSTYEVHMEVVSGSQSVECTGKIVASAVSEDNCEILDFKCDALYSSESATLKSGFEDFVPITLKLAGEILDKQDIDVDLSDFGFVKFDN